jgi:hypothetical protein
VPLHLCEKIVCKGIPRLRAYDGINAANRAPRGLPYARLVVVNPFVVPYLVGRVDGQAEKTSAEFARQDFLPVLPAMPVRCNMVRFQGKHPAARHYDAERGQTLYELSSAKHKSTSQVNESTMED